VSSVQKTEKLENARQKKRNEADESIYPFLTKERERAREREREGGRGRGSAKRKEK